jgi:hypothetical protein
MAPPVLPTLKGASYPVKRIPMWKTLHQEAVSGQDNPIPLWSFPKWRYEVPYNAFNSGGTAFQGLPALEWQTLATFFNTVQGSALVFQFTDPDDGAVTDQLFGTGDGATVAFPLVRTMAGIGGAAFVEPVFAPVNPQISKNADWQGKQLQYATARTNVLLQSNTFSNAAYGKTNCTVTSNSGTSPDGTNDAWLWQRSSTAAAYIFQGISGKPASALVYTGSIYAKPGTGNFLALRLADANGSASVTFNVSTGVISLSPTTSGPWSGASASIIAAANGFYRCSLTAASSTDTNLTEYWSGNSNNVTLDGTDSVSNTTILAFGEQLEQQNIATSYIATTIVAVTVTDYALGTQGLVTFSTAPLAAAILSWTGTYNWLCRFDADATDFEKFMNRLWECKALKFTTIKTQSK